MNLVSHALGFLSGLIGREPAPAARAPLGYIPSGPNVREMAMLVDNYDASIWDGTPYVCQTKLDGIRAIYVDGRIMTREGAPLDCALHCLPALQRIEAAYGQPMMIDAEYTHEAGRFAADADRKRGHGSGVMWCFDAISAFDWHRGRCDLPVALRLAGLAKHHKAGQSLFVGMIAGKVVHSHDEMMAQAEKVWSLGYEGLVLKRGGSGYVRRRSKDWLKVKKRIVKVVPVIEVLVKGGAFKGLIVRGPTGPLVVTNGFSSIEQASYLLLAGRGLDGQYARCAWYEVAGSAKPQHAVFLSGEKA